MVTEFCGFKHGVIGTDKMPADTTLNNMKKADLIKLLHTAQHNYETLMWFYNNAVKANMAQLNNNGWVPCSEKLPEVKKEVLIFAYDGAMFVGCLMNGGFSVHDGDGWIDLKFILAWQPLPEPYQKGGADW